MELSAASTSFSKCSHLTDLRLGAAPRRCYPSVAFTVSTAFLQRATDYMAKLPGNLAPYPGEPAKHRAGRPTLNNETNHPKAALWKLLNLMIPLKGFDLAGHYISGDP
jgi:hypothetical protein